LYVRSRRDFYLVNDQAGSPRRRGRPLARNDLIFFVEMKQNGFGDVRSSSAQERAVRRKNERLAARLAMPRTNPPLPGESVREGFPISSSIGLREKPEISLGRLVVSAAARRRAPRTNAQPAAINVGRSSAPCVSRA
jgi:hypothetical protein